MVDNIIKSVAEKLSSLSYIEGIVLGGSRARGTHTEDSDIDIGIYYNSESFDINTINQFATKLDDEHRNNLVVPPVYPQSRKTAPKSKISTIAERVWYNEIDGGSQPQEGAMYL